MAGTLEGGKAAAKTNKQKYGSDFYAKIGAKGGSKGVTGGFYADRELARRAGSVGGRKSKRGKATAGLTVEPASPSLWQRLTRRRNV